MILPILSRSLARTVGRATLALSCATVFAQTLDAQTLAQQTRSAAGGSGPSRMISINPFLPLFGYFAGEFEQRVAPAAAVALAMSHIKPNDTRYTNVDAKLRIYPSETFVGFNMAGSLGIARIQDTDAEDCVIPDGGGPCTGKTTRSFTTGSFAVEGAYQWLLGPSQVMAVTVGAGAKRYLGAREKFRGVERVLPTVRLTVGYAF